MQGYWTIKLQVLPIPTYICYNYIYVIIILRRMYIKLYACCKNNACKNKKNGVMYDVWMQEPTEEHLGEINLV